MNPRYLPPSTVPPPAPDDAASRAGSTGVPVVPDRAPPLAGDLRSRVRRFEELHPAKPARAVNAPDPGRVLSRVRRPDGTELRVSVHEYNGAEFVRVCPWATSDGGASWWPVKGKGVTVKVRELPAVASALVDAMESTAPNEPAPTGRERR